MNFKFRDIRKDDGAIKPIERMLTTYTPMISRKSSLYRKDPNLSDPKRAICEIRKSYMENGYAQQDIHAKPKTLVRNKKRSK